MSRNAGQAAPRQYETTCGSRFPNSLVAEVTTEAVCRWWSSPVSQGDELNASWFNIIEMVDPLSADYCIVKQRGDMGVAGRQSSLQGYFDTLSIANHAALIIT